MSKRTDNLALAQIQNAFIMPVEGKPLTLGTDRQGQNLFNKSAGGSRDVRKNLGNSAIPVPPLRQRQDPVSWRNAVIEAEMSILPYRVKMQQIFRDTVLNPHIRASIDKRKNLTMLREFALIDSQGNKDEEWTAFLKKQWFNNFLSYALDARFFGFSLISLGDINQNELPELTIIRRDNISPERMNVSAAPYIPTGESWDSPEYAPWHIWVPTPNEHGTTSCGFGILYSIAFTEILLRNMTSNNADFMEVFASPYRALFMDINNEEERANAEQALEAQGSLGWGVFGKDDKLELLDARGGNGYKSYSDFEMRMEKKISKVLLGHSDAIDSTAGKLGASQGGGKDGGDHSPAQQALNEIQQSDANFLEPIINKELLTRLRYHGINVPDDLSFVFLNGDEDEEMLRRKNEVNLSVSAIVKNLTGSNLQVDATWFEDTTGIKVVDRPIQAPGTEQKINSPKVHEQAI